MIAALPHMRRILEIFDPIILETKSADSHLADAIKFTKSSGADVPKARMVSPITMGGIQNFFAICPLQSTSISPHRINDINHNIMNNVESKMPVHHSKRGFV